MRAWQLAFSAGFAVACALAWAQPVPRFERNPIEPTQVTLYGRVAAGLLKPIFEGEDEPKHRGVGSLTRSFIGLRGVEPLSNGLSAHLQLEHSLEPDTGTCWRGCSSFWHGRATVGLALRQWGRIDIGRRDQPAWKVALSAEPWDGNTVASPEAMLYVVPKGGEARSSNSITLGTPEDRDVVLELQWSATEGAGTPMADRGLAIRFGQGALRGGAGWQHWSDGSYALPLALTYRMGWTTAYAGYTVGQANGDDYSTAFLGASFGFFRLGDPMRVQARVGYAHLSYDGGRRDQKAAAGLRYRLSARTHAAFDLTWVQRDGDGAPPRHGRGVEVGLVHTFSRDLRYPQVPW
jgi:predicted porin